MASLRSIALLALSTGIVSMANAQASGSGTTTRYWDCCKGSCAWSGKADVSNPVTTCDINDQPLTDYNAASGCSGGSAYMCSSQSPWAVNDTLAYGFAAVNIAGGSEAPGAALATSLPSPPPRSPESPQTMIVQATNTGGDLGSNQFDLAMPGGGVGIYNGCTDEWGAPASGWGAQYGGISSNTCSSFPSALQPGCDFRFDWFEGADNPTVDFEQVTCPKAITDKTGCVRAGETPTTDASTGSAAAASSSVVASSSSSAAALVASISPSEAAPAAPVESSSSAPVVYTPSAGTASTTTLDGSAVMSGAYSFTSTIPSSSSQIAPVLASSSSAAEEAPSCHVQYVYEYDL
ncbi:hypothetical protein H2203_002344 [Taxawa tesnikishii (nom. ined.)]|nr:hypothetical protein H2203_002344 [Dothideales sp. JES 119]